MRLWTNEQRNRQKEAKAVKEALSKVSDLESQLDDQKESFGGNNKTKKFQSEFKRLN